MADGPGWLNAVYVTMLDHISGGMLSAAEAAQKWDEVFRWGSMTNPEVESWGELPSQINDAAALDVFALERPDPT